MSHKATNWAITQRGLTPAAKIVLWHLADCHNPAHGCFPSQAYLADACEMHRATVNRHLDNLESAGLIRREQVKDPTNQRQMSTRYYLNMDGPVSQNETRAVSQNMAEPCRKNEPSRVANCDTNLVREPLREPVRPPNPQGGLFGSEQIPEGITDPDVGDPAMKKETESESFDRFWAAYPKCKRKTDKPMARAVFSAILHGKQKGIGKTSAAPIIAGVEGYAASNPDQEYIPQPARWLRGARWEQTMPAVQAQQHDSWLPAAKRLVLSEIGTPAGLGQEARMALSNIRMVEPNWRPQA